MSILPQPRSSPPGRLPTTEEVQQFGVALEALCEYCLELDCPFNTSRLGLTALLSDLRRDPLNVFLEYSRIHPQLTRGLVAAGRRELDRRTADLAAEVWL